MNTENATEHVLDLRKNKEERKSEGSWLDLLRFAVVALLIVLPTRFYIAQPFIVSGASMVPSFFDGDYLIVDEISYKLREPDRGEVVIFKYPKDETKFFIKRIIGLPGETVNIENGVVSIKNATSPEGFVLDEPYIANIPTNTIKRTLGENEFFVMGDNRLASSDSRIWGPVDERQLVGRALARLFPVDSISYLPGDFNF